MVEHACAPGCGKRWAQLACTRNHEPGHKFTPARAAWRAAQRCKSVACKLHSLLAHTAMACAWLSANREEHEPSAIKWVYVTSQEQPLVNSPAILSFQADCLPTAQDGTATQLVITPTKAHDYNYQNPILSLYAYCVLTAQDSKHSS
eukprot:scaffold103805_cov28-Tisochrysis_lutea.AAC.1